MLRSGNGIVVEPSALRMAAQSTEIGNSSLNGWKDQNYNVLSFLENDEITSWTTMYKESRTANPPSVR